MVRAQFPSARGAPSSSAACGVCALTPHSRRLPPALPAGFRSVGVDEKQGLGAEVFSSVAPRYDVMNDLMSAGMHRLWKDHLVQTLRPAPGQVHLDVAGGTGDVAFRVLAALRTAERVAAAQGRAPPPGGPGTVLVSDINPSMLAEGRKRADAAGYRSLDVALDESKRPWCVARRAGLPMGVP